MWGRGKQDGQGGDSPLERSPAPLPLHLSFACEFRTEATISRHSNHHPSSPKPPPHLEAAEDGLDVTAASDVDVDAVDVGDGGDGPGKRDVQSVVVVAT